MLTTLGTQKVAPEEHKMVYADILSQAVSGELIGMQNYASMVGMFEDDVAGQTDAVEHAYSEFGHAVAFRKAAAELGVNVIENPRAVYWRRIHEAFLGLVREGDVTACLIVQEIMLESFAVSMYHAVADVTEGKLGQIFRAIGAEEESHLQHAIAELQQELAVDRDGFEQKVHGLHEKVMTILNEMVAKEDVEPCELCAGDCIKTSLHEIGLSASYLRGKTLAFYLSALDRVGVRGEKSLAWVANLPE